MIKTRIQDRHIAELYDFNMADLKNMSLYFENIIRLRFLSEENKPHFEHDGDITKEQYKVLSL
jgi:hypothetical protein